LARYFAWFCSSGGRTGFSNTLFPSFEAFCFPSFETFRAAAFHVIEFLGCKQQIVPDGNRPKAFIGNTWHAT
jgi:hypothetical protein